MVEMVEMGEMGERSGMGRCEVENRNVLPEMKICLANRCDKKTPGIVLPGVFTERIAWRDQ